MNGVLGAHHTNNHHLSATVNSPGSFLIPVRNIKSRLVHVKCTYRDFGRMLGNDTGLMILFM